MSKAQEQRDEVAHAIKTLQDLKPGDVLYTVLNHVSRSGMRRSIDVFLATKSGEIENLSYYIAHALGRKIDQKNGGIICNGAGMDMGFELVYALGRCLFRDGFIPKTAGMNGRNGTPDNQRDTDGGYALRHRWL